MSVPIPDSSRDERLHRFARQWAYYTGDHPEPLTTSVDNVTVNNAGTIVDVGVDFLFGTSSSGRSVAFRVESDTGDVEAAQAALDTAWDANRKDTLLRMLGINGGVTGHAWLRIVPDESGDGAHRIVNVDPANVSVAYDAEDYERLLLVRLEWVAETVDGLEAWREDHTLAEDGASWSITRYRLEQRRALGFGMGTITADQWVQEGDVVDWPYAWCQLHHCQNLPRPNEFWGSADIELDVRRVNDALNRVASNAHKTLRHFAHPKPIGYGFTPTDIEFDNAIGDMIVVPSSDGRIENLEMKSDLRSVQVMLEWLDAKQWEVARVPKIAAGRVDQVGALSSLALEILYRPLIAKTNTKRDLYGDLLRQVCRHLLELSGIEGVDVVIDWPEVLPRNERDDAEVARIDLELGASRETILEARGYDPAVELERRRVEDTAGLGTNVGLAGLFADLGTAAQTVQPPDEGV